MIKLMMLLINACAVDTFFIHDMSRNVGKRTFGHVRLAMIQISLRVSAG